MLRAGALQAGPQQAVGREAVGPRVQRKGWEAMCVEPPRPPGRGLEREGGWSEAEEELERVVKIRWPRTLDLILLREVAHLGQGLASGTGRSARNALLRPLLPSGPRSREDGAGAETG